MFLNTYGPETIGQHFIDDIFQYGLLNEKFLNFTEMFAEGIVDVSTRSGSGLVLNRLEAITWAGFLSLTRS